MKRRVSRGNRWADHYTHKARKDNYPARSVYKLQQIQGRFRILKKGQRVLDLGCAPGSWLLYAAQVVGPSGRVLGIDLKPVTLHVPAQVEVFQGDVLDRKDAPWATLGSDFEVVMSDMAPATSGRSDVDAARSFNLAQAALEIAQTHLAPGGALICKIFQGADFDQYSQLIAEHFSKQKRFRPAATRKASREIYIIAMGKK